MAEFKLPELGEGITSGTITKILVKEGDAVRKDQPVVELETEKAVVEVPSSVDGTVEQILVKEGDTVKVGQALMTLAEGGAAAAPPPPKEQPPQEKAEAAPPQEPPARVEQPAPSREVEPRGRQEEPEVVEEEETEEELMQRGEARRPVRAAPSVRRLARELGIDLQEVHGSGLGGRITPSDVRAHAERGVERGAKPAAEAAPSPAEGKPEKEARPGMESDSYGEIEREPMSGVRKKTAEHISTAWEQIPHVTQFDSADITDLEAFRKEYGKRVESGGGKLTMTVLIMKVVAHALRKFRQFNAVVDMENEQIIFKKYINIGVAVDTAAGLIVPVVRNADAKSLAALAAEVTELAEKARTRKVSIEDLQGGTFTVTNLGGIGGLWFTPIIKSPEVAILGVSRARVEPVWHEEEDFERRLMLPLSLSYDHRIIDGADAARFMRWLVEALEQPWLLMMD